MGARKKQGNLSIVFGAGETLNKCGRAPAPANSLGFPLVFSAIKYLFRVPLECLNRSLPLSPRTLRPVLRILGALRF